MLFFAKEREDSPLKWQLKCSRSVEKEIRKLGLCVCMLGRERRVK